MNIDLDSLTEQELIELNRDIVERIRMFGQIRTQLALLEFRIGQRAYFDTDSGVRVVGTVALCQKNTVTLHADDGQRWKVASSLLRRPADQAGLHERLKGQPSNSEEQTGFITSEPENPLDLSRADFDSSAVPLNANRSFLKTGDELQKRLPVLKQVGTTFADSLVSQPNALNLALDTPGAPHGEIAAVSQGGTVPISSKAVVMGVVDQTGKIRGLLEAGSVTDERSPLIKGALSSPLASGETVRIFDGDTYLGDALCNGLTWAFKDSRLLQDGQIVHYLARVANFAGQESETDDGFSVTIDLSPSEIQASLAAIEDSQGRVVMGPLSDGVTRGSFLLASGVLSSELGSGETLQIYDGDEYLGDAMVSGLSWKFLDQRPLTEGHQLTYSLRVTDVAGNQSPQETASRVVIDQTPPDVHATVDALVDNVGLLMGRVADGGVTDDLTPTLTGTLSAALGFGERVRIYDGEQYVGDAKVTGLGWRFEENRPLQDGQQLRYSARVMDAAGNETLSLGAYEVVVDQSGPGIEAKLTSIEDDQGLLRGPVASGGVTDDLTPTLTGTLSAALGFGERVRIYDGEQYVGDAKVTGLGWRFEENRPLQDGQQLRYSARVMDAAGNETLSLGAYEVVVDQSGPDIEAKLTSIEDDQGLLRGPVASGGVTDDLTPTLTGTLSAALGFGERVRIYDGEQYVGDAKVTGLGWRFEENRPLQDGQQLRYSARVMDAAGNETLSLGTYEVWVDSSAPSQLASVSSILDDQGTVRGKVAADGRTDDTTLTLTGELSDFLEDGARVRIYDGIQYVGDAEVTGLQWTFSDPRKLQDGQVVNYRARVNDSVGNLSPGGRVYSASIDTTSPETQAAVSSVKDDSGPVTGAVLNGMTTDDRVLEVLGTLTNRLRSNEIVKVFDGEIFLGKARVSGNQWQFSDERLLVDGQILNYMARVVDAAGNESAAGEAFAVTIDTTAPLVQTDVESVMDDFGIFKGQVGRGGATDDTQLEITGSLSELLSAGETVEVYDGTIRLGNAKVEGERWFYEDQRSLRDGQTVHFSARVVDSAGNSSSNTSDYQLTLDRSPPTNKAVVTGILDDTGLVLGNILSGGSTDDRTPTLTGSLSGPLREEETVRIYDGINYLGNASVTGKTWSYTDIRPLVDGQVVSYRARVADSTGNQSIPGSAYRVKIRAETDSIPDSSFVALKPDADPMPAESQTLSVALAGGPFFGRDLLYAVFDIAGDELSHGHFIVDAQSGMSAVCLPLNYDAPCLVVVTDKDPETLDYLDEFSGQTLSLARDASGYALRALVPGGVVSGGVTVSPLTELAVQLSGVTEGKAFSTQALDWNSAVGDLFGILNPVTTGVRFTNTAAYQPTDGVSSEELYGEVLAVLSAADSLSGSMKATLERLVQGVSLSNEMGWQATPEVRSLLASARRAMEAKMGSVNFDEGLLSVAWLDHKLGVETLSGWIACDRTVNAPQVLDYLDAGIAGVSRYNLQIANKLIKMDESGRVGFDAGALEVLSAHEILAQWAEGGVREPDKATFEQAGLFPLSDMEVRGLNVRLKLEGAGAADTREKLGELLVMTRESMETIQNWIGGSMTIRPTVQDYLTVGIEGVSSLNLDAVNQSLCLRGAAAPPVSEGDLDLNAALIKMAAFARGEPIPAPSIEDYEVAGIDGVNAYNLAIANQLLPIVDERDPSLLHEVIRASMLGHSARLGAMERIGRYADNGKIPPCVDDYLDAGVLGVTHNNLDSVNQLCLAGQFATHKSKFRSAFFEETVDVETRVRLAMGGEIFEKFGSSKTLSISELSQELGQSGAQVEQLQQIYQTLGAESLISKAAMDAIADQSARDTAMAKILAFATVNITSSEALAPSLVDYINAGIKGVAGHNLSIVNESLRAAGIQGLPLNQLGDFQAGIDVNTLAREIWQKEFNESASEEMFFKIEQSVKKFAAAVQLDLQTDWSSYADIVGVERALTAGDLNLMLGRDDVVEADMDRIVRHITGQNAMPQTENRLYEMTQVIRSDAFVEKVCMDEVLSEPPDLIVRLVDAAPGDSLNIYVAGELAYSKTLGNEEIDNGRLRLAGEYFSGSLWSQPGADFQAGILSLDDARPMILSDPYV